MPGRSEPARTVDVAQEETASRRRARGRSIPPATVKPQRIDCANDSSTDFRSRGFALLERKHWFGWTSMTRRADAMEADDASLSAAAAIEADVVRAEASREPGRE